MPWKDSPMMQREELVALATAPGANRRELARRAGVSRKTLYKWIGRRAQAAEGRPWSQDLSRRPGCSPERTVPDVERAALRVREENPAWGARKIAAVLEREGVQGVPAVSTVHAILQRHGMVEQGESQKREHFQRFEHESPNDLWQIDFKGHFATARGRCHPLTVVDDHSRYAVCVTACPDEKDASAWPALVAAMRLHGLPLRVLLDNGSCWGRVESSYTAFSARLLRLGVRIAYARPFRPQTKGKNERFNATLKAEAIGSRNFADLADCQRAFDEFRLKYNAVRPHEALDMQVPASRYRVSPLAFPETLPPIEYAAGDVVRQVGKPGYISLEKERYHVGRAFAGQPVALRATDVDGVLEVYFVHQRVAVIDRRMLTCAQA